MSQAVVGGVTTNYTYYADGLRRTKTTNSETTMHMWDGDNIIADLDGSYVLTDSYIRGVGGNLEIYENDFDGWMCFSTIHGDIKEVMAIGTGVSDWYSYDAYGNITGGYHESTDNPFRYCGEYYDEETGFIYLRARYYDPTIGRFVSEDTHWNPDNMIYGDNPRKSNENKIPSIEAILQSNNVYAYCMNNPVMYVDSNGEWVMIIDLGISVGIGVYGKLSVALAFDDDKNAALLINGGIGGGAGASAGATVYTYDDMDSIKELKNATSVSIGGGIGKIGASMESSGNYVTVAGSATEGLKGILPPEVKYGYYATLNGSITIFEFLNEKEEEK